MPTTRAQPSESYRWTARRKAALVADAHALDDQQLDALLERHGISREEIDRWVRLFEQRGLGALKATKLQEHRRQARDTEAEAQTRSEN